MTSAITVVLSAALAFQVAPTRVEVTPERTEVEVAGTVSLTARVLDASGRHAPTAAVRWITSTPELASVDEQGTVTGIAPGDARITAVAGGATASVFVTVVPMPVAELEVDVPDTGPLAGQSVPLRVVARNRLGEVVDAPPLTYRSEDPAVAAIDGAGLIFARTAGSTRLTARAGSVAASTDVRVRPAQGLSYSIAPAETQARTGDVVRLRVAARAGGSEVPAHPVWTVSGSGADIVDEDGEGVFVAEQPGTYRVTAQVGERTAVSAIVRVEPRGLQAELVELGRGPISEHHSGDVWVFEGLDGRDYAYIGTFLWDWMKVWDVTDPSAPVLTDSLQLDARRINDVKIHPNNRVGIVTREGASSRRNGIVILDLTTPAHPTVAAEYTETVTGGVHNVWIDGEHDLVYAVHNGTRAIHIIDISSPAAPREVGRWQLDNERRSLHDVIVQDGYLYASYWDDGAVVLDVGADSHGGTPTRPAFVSQYKYPVGNTHVAWRHGRYLFVGDEIFPADWDADRPIEARGYIRVLDMGDIENPVEVARYEVPEAGAHNVWTEGDRLYVGYYQGGLRVLDISGELRGDLYRQGRELAVLKTTDADAATPNWPMTWGAQVFKGRIYSSDLNSGLWVTQLRERPRPIS